MRFVLVAVGGILGAGLASPGSRVFGLWSGAFAGFAAGELLSLRSRVAALDGEINRLRIEQGLRQTLPSAPGASPDTPVEPRRPTPDSAPSQPAAIAMSAVYLACAWLLKRRRNQSQALLIEAFIALGVAFLTLAVPLALNARLNAATWALEGTALIWVGCRQRRLLPRVAGALLNLASGCILSTQFNVTPGHTFLPLASYFRVLTQSVAANGSVLSSDSTSCWNRRWFKPRCPYSGPY